MAGIQGISAFVETARNRSFAAAARNLGLSASAVAKGVARLESDLGVRLFNRTTRQVSLTADGRELFARCQRIVEELEALQESAAGTRSAPTGTLTVGCSVTLGKQVLVPLLVKLARQHPALRVELNLTDRYVDILRERLDAVVRVGELTDSSLVAQRIGQMSYPCLASPAYIEQHGAPRDPDDALGHQWILFRNPSSGRLRPVLFGKGERARSLSPSPAMVIDDGEAMVVAAAEGLGLVQLPLHMVAGALAAGELVEVLAKHAPPPAPVSLVYPSARNHSPRLQALIQALKKLGPVDA